MKKSFFVTLKFLLFICLTAGIEKESFSSVKDSGTGSSYVDLWQSDFTSGLAVTSGESFVISSLIHNSGTKYSGFYSTAYYLSSDTELNISGDTSSSSGDILLGTTSAQSTSAGAVYPDSLPVFNFPAVTTGNYYIICYTDYTNAVEESDETNNINIIPLTVEEAYIDLLADSPNFPDSLSAGYEALAFYNLKNAGSKTASGFFGSYYISNDTILDDADIFVGSSYLYASAHSSNYTGYSFTVPQIPIGQYYFLYVLDKENSVVETNEENNILHTSFKVTSPVLDLVAGDMELRVANIAPGDQLYLYFKLANVGTIPSGNNNAKIFISQDDLLDPSDLVVYQTMFQGIPPVRDYTNAAWVTIPASFSPGTYYFIQQIEVDSEREENNELNNISVLKFEIIPSDVDLSLAFDNNQIDVLKQGYLYASFTEVNQGATQAALHTYKYYLSTDTVADNQDLFIGEDYLSPIQGLESIRRGVGFSLPYSVENGSYYLVLVDDENNLIKEANENNNIAYTKVNVHSPEFDLAVKNLNINTAPLYPGLKFNLNFEVHELANAPVWNANVNVYISKDTVISDDDKFISIQNCSVDHGNPSFVSSDLLLPSDLTSGSYYIICAVDYDNEIAELNEANNHVYQPIVVNPIDIDLSISEVQVANQKIVLGYPTSVKFKVLNNGSTSLVDNFVNVVYYISQDTIFDLNDLIVGGNGVYTLNANSSVEINDSFTAYSILPSGRYYLLCIADRDNVLSETNESNNIKYCKVNVVRPDVDLRIKYATLESSTIYKDTPFIVSNYVLNTGSLVSNGNFTGYVLSKDTILDFSQDMILGSRYVNELAGNDSISQSAYISIFGGIESGDYYLLIAADAYGFQIEKNEKNNVVAKKIKVKDRYVDLDVTLPSVSKSQLQAGESFVVKQSSLNRGNADAYYTDINYYLSTDKVASPDDYRLDPYTIFYIPAKGEHTDSTILVVPYTIAAGKYYLIYYIDGDNRCPESNETNNIATKPITIVPNSLRAAFDANDLDFNHNVSIAPNPANESINVNLSGDMVGKEVTFTLSDLTGVKIYESSSLNQTSKFKIPSNQLNPGIYTLQVECEGKVDVVKVIKQ